MEIRNPVLKGLAALLGLAVGAVAVALAMLLAGAALFGWRRTRVQRRIDRPMVKATSGVRLLSPRENIASSCTSFDRR